MATSVDARVSLSGDKVCVLLRFRVRGLRLRRATMHSRKRAPLYCLPHCLTPSAPWMDDFGAHNFGIPSLHMPLSRLPCAPIRRLCLVVLQRFECALAVRPRMARGQDGSLLLSCMTLSFTTSRRFIPTLSSARRRPTFFIHSGDPQGHGGTPCGLAPIK